MAATVVERNGRLQVVRELIDQVVWGTRDRFVLALANLIRNAAQAAPGAGATLRISVSRDGEVATLRFEDDGPGIPEQDVGRLFEPGFSVRRSAEGVAGSGWGLAIVRKVVEEEMGGSVGYVPGANRGAVFIIRLPVVGGVTS